MNTRRKLAAIMFTDMVGSTKLKQDLGDREAVRVADDGNEQAAIRVHCDADVDELLIHELLVREIKARVDLGRVL